jgi:hypothetical protein
VADPRSSPIQRCVSASLALRDDFVPPLRTEPLQLGAYHQLPSRRYQHGMSRASNAARGRARPHLAAQSRDVLSYAACMTSSPQRSSFVRVEQQHRLAVESKNKETGVACESLGLSQFIFNLCLPTSRGSSPWRGTTRYAHVERHRETMTICDYLTPGTGPRRRPTPLLSNSTIGHKLLRPAWPLYGPIFSHIDPFHSTVARVRERRLQKPESLRLP